MWLESVPMASVWDSVCRGVSCHACGLRDVTYGTEWFCLSQPSIGKGNP